MPDAQIDAEPGSTLLSGARLIIGDGGTVLEPADLLIRNGMIESVGHVSGAQADARIDLSGKTIMPTIINMHGHIGYLKGATTDKANYSRENVLDHLHRLAYYGISVFQSLGTDRDDIELAVRDDQRAGRLDDPTLAMLLTASTGLVAPTPGFANGGAYFATDVLQEVDSPAAGRAAVRRVAAKGPDVIKLWVDDRDGTKAKMGPAVYQAIIDEAHSLGLRAIAHIFTLEDAKGVVAAGADGIAHMVREPGPDDELIDLLRTNGTFAFTSMSIQKSVRDGAGWLDDPALAETVSPDALEYWRAAIASASPQIVADSKRTYDILEAGLRKYVAGGVRVALSGDTGLVSQFPGFAEHRELEAMVEAGMPALQAIHAATGDPAKLLGLLDRGTLDPGKRADLLILHGNPLDDIANTRRINAVYLAGQRLDRDAMRAALQSG
jgi:imidazolonepropionase-like amidohydrolase